MNKVMFCQNQFAWMSKNAFASYRHTKSIQDKVGLLSGMINFADHDSKIADLTLSDSLHQFNDIKFDKIYHLACWTQAGDFSIKHAG